MRLGHVLRHESLLHDNRGENEGGILHEVGKIHLLNDLMNGKDVALKRTAEDRKEWQKLIRAGSHKPAS